MLKRKIILFVFFLALLSGGNTAYSQAVPSQIEFSRIKVDELSDQQVRQFIARAQSMGMSMQELETEAIKRGMPYSEVAKLRKRIQELEKTTEKPDRVQSDATRRISDEDYLSFKTTDSVQVELPDTVLRVFGYDLFRRDNLSFEPSLNIPTPTNYQVGPGDELLVEVWGASQQSYQLTVSPEGQVNISNLGPITVSGLAVEKASELIIQRLSTIYSGLRGANANTFAQVSVGNVRSIKITIAGDAYMPGTFTLPAFATAFNALYLAGGPSERGSFRDIRIIRGGSEIARLDLYDFLVKGQTSLNLRLQDEDLIFIGPYRNRASLSGEVIRPAIYELKENETLADLIAFGGGFTASAYTTRLQVDRKTESRRRLLNVESELFSSFLMKAGDEIEVGKILDLYENRISIRGAVHREGDYALTEGMTVKMLIQQAEGLRDDAFTNRAALYRQKDNLETLVVDLNLHEIMQGSATDVLLQKEDLLMISSILELKQERTVRVMGEVQMPDLFPWAEGLTLGEVIRLAGGLNDAASLARVEVARRISNRTATASTLATSEIFSFPLDENLTLQDQAASFALYPFDMIFVRRSPAYQTQQLVQVKGEVVFPGSYAVANKTEYISDLIRRAGGLSEQAYLPGATLVRRIEESPTNRRRHMETLEAGSMEFISEMEDSVFQYIGINLERILQNPKSQHDLILLNGDMLNIPRELQTVRMTGAVLHPTSARYQRNIGVRGYITRAGGFADSAMKNKVYVIYPNGSVDRTHNFLFFRSYPPIEPGSEIIVPMKPQREGRSLQETIAISSAITSMALIVVTIINQFK